MSTIELSSKSERIKLYHFFGDDGVIDLMPQLIQAGYNPAGIAVIADRRQTAPEDVLPNWNTSFFTGDSSTTDKKGGALLTLDSPILRQLTAESPLANGALQLTREQVAAVKEDRNSLYLTSEEVEEAHGKGYVLQKGVFVPVTKGVAKAWDHLLRGKDVQSYARLVSEASKSNNIMRVYFDRSKPTTPTLRSLLVRRISYYSNVLGSHDLNGSGGSLAGVSGTVLEARIQAALKEGTEFEFEGRLYILIEASVVDRLRK